MVSTVMSNTFAWISTTFAAVFFSGGGIVMKPENLFHNVQSPKGLVSGFAKEEMRQSAS
jgi:hypothetical protein